MTPSAPFPQGQTTANLRRFLDELRGAQQELHRADSVALDELEPPPRRCGEEFRELATTLAIPCPEELVALGDALGAGRVWCGAWELLTASEAASKREFLTRAAASAPSLGPRAQMLPIFNRDGDLLLLGADGAIRMFTFDGFERDNGVVADTLDELLGRMVRRERLPFDQR